MKKFLSVLLAVAMVLSCFAGLVLAADETDATNPKGGSGGNEDDYVLCEFSEAVMNPKHMIWDTEHTKNNKSGSGLFLAGTEAQFFFNAESDPATWTSDFTQYKCIRFWVYGNSKVPTNLYMRFLTEGSPLGDKDHYAYVINIKQDGWQEVVVPFDEMKTVRNPTGWDKISMVQFVTNWGAEVANSADSQVYFDTIYLSNRVPEKATPTPKPEATPTPTPEPSKIDNAVCLMLDVPTALKNGEKTQIDPDNANVVPFTVNDRTMVPFRFIGEALGANVEYQGGEEEKVFITLGSDKVELTIGSDQMLVNGTASTLEAPAMLKDDRTFVPLRACAEAFGKEVFWDPQGLIIISDIKDIYDVEKDADEILDIISEIASPQLADIKINGESIEGFKPDVYEYNVALPYGTTELPELEVVANAGCKAEITKKATELPGTFEIKVSLPSVAGMFNRYRVNVRVVGEIDITDSHHEEGNGPDHTRDGDLATRWASDGESWIQYDFANPKEISKVQVAVWKSAERKTKLTIQISEDGKNYETIFDGETSATSDVLEDFPLPKTTTVKSIKILGHGNTADNENTAVWTSILEVDWQ